MENINTQTHQSQCSPSLLQVASSPDSKSSHIYKLLSVQDYLLEQMKVEEDIFKVQDFERAIFRIDDCIQLMSHVESPASLAN